MTDQLRTIQCADAFWLHTPHAAHDWTQGPDRPAVHCPGVAERYTASTVNDDALDQLYAERDRAVAAVGRALRLAKRWAVLRAHGGAANELRAALADPKEQSTP